MGNTSANNKRIAKNTLLLYVRMSLLIVVQLYTVPIILQALGVEDYGIYNVVGGVVTMFSFIGGSLASGSQRFIAFEIGRGDKERLKKIFDTTVTIYLLLALVAGFLLEIGGYWFLNTQMNIPQERIYAANWVLQLSIWAFLINLVSIPYNAAVIAHERMSLYAYVSIWECVLKLAAAIALQYVLFDKLILYAVFICAITVSVRVIYQLYCRRHFEECRHYRFSRQTYMGKSLLAYSGWNMIGAVATILKKQGLNIVMNVFFGAILNTAHAIALQISGFLEQFISNIYMATRPQITKLYAAEKQQEMWNLVYGSNKLVFYLLTLLIVPAIIEMDTILRLWLHEFPYYTIPIIRLMLISLLIETLINQVIAVCQAYNRIKEIQLYSCSMVLLNVPISYIGLKIYPNFYLLPYIVQVSCSILFVLSILYVSHKVIGLNLRVFFQRFALRCIIVFILIYGSVYYLSSLFNPTWERTILSVVFTLGISPLLIYYLGLTRLERKKCISIYQSYKKSKNGNYKQNQKANSLLH